MKQRIEFTSYGEAVAHARQHGGEGLIASRPSQRRVFWYSPGHTIEDVLRDRDMTLHTLTSASEYAGHERRLKTPYSLWAA